MTDKLRKTYPLRITFGSGEQPTSAKLSAMSEQTRNGLSIVESAIGDLWNHSGDSLLSTIPLQIPNLARLLGQNSYLNPAIYPIEETVSYKEFIGSKFPNEVNGFLTFKPETSSSPVISDQVGGSGSLQTDEYLVGRTGNPYDYWVSDETGEFRVNLPMTSSGTYCTYDIDPATDWLVEFEALPGVIPDVRQQDFTGCRLELNGGKYFLHLPPRQPLTFDTKEVPNKYPATEDQADSYNFATSTGSPYKMWQSSTSSALAEQHYRYSLPKELRDAFASMDPGDEYPQGVMYLWDKSQETIVDGLVFKKPSAVYTANPWVIEVESSGYTDLDDYVTTPNDETEAAYNSDLTLITCGTPIARNLWQLMTSMLNHEHNNDKFHTSQISHGNLTEVDPPVATGNDHSARYPSYMPHWPASAWMYDDHVSLLSRGGSQGSADATRRDPYDNAMLGDLVIANADTSGSDNFLDEDCTDDSWKLCFGATDGPSFNFQFSSGFVLETQTGPSKLVLSPQSSGQTSAIELGQGGSGNRSAYIDFIGDSTYSDYGLRIIRNNTGENASSEIYHQGTGDFNIRGLGSSQININNAAGAGMSMMSNGIIRVPTRMRVGTDADPASGYDLHVSGKAQIDNDLQCNGTTYMDLDAYVGQDLNVTGDIIGTNNIYLQHSGSPTLYIRSTATSNQQGNIVLRGARTGAAAILGSIQAFNNESADDGTVNSQINFIRGSVTDSSAIDFYTRNGGSIGLSMRIDSGGMVYMNGPFLDIDGAVRARGGAPGATGANYNGYAFNSPGDNDSGMFSEGDGQVNFYANNQEELRITTSLVEAFDPIQATELRSDTYKWNNGSGRTMKIWIGPAQCTHGLVNDSVVDKYSMNNGKSITWTGNSSQNYVLVPFLWPSGWKLNGWQAYVGVPPSNAVSGALYSHQIDTPGNEDQIGTTATTPVGAGNTGLARGSYNLAREDLHVYYLKFWNSTDGGNISSFHGIEITFTAEEAFVENWSL